MKISTEQIEKIRLKLAKLKPKKVTLDNRSLTIKEAISP